MTGEVETGTEPAATMPRAGSGNGNGNGPGPGDGPTTARNPETFDEMELHPEVKQALLEMGFIHPMPVQQAVYPRMMAGKDLLVQSRTGSGKTAAFGIPFAQKLISGDEKRVQALVLAPTRELALQSA